MLSMEKAQESAANIGPATARLVQSLMDDRRDNVRRVLALRERYGDYRLEAACERAWHFGDPSRTTLKRILEKALATQPLPAPPTSAPGRTFARTAAESLGALFGASPRQ